MQPIRSALAQALDDGRCFAIRLQPVQIIENDDKIFVQNTA
jgi:hypothetical protein